MKGLRMASAIILSLILFFLGIKIYRSYTFSRNLKNKEKIRLQQNANLLNKCFDLDNKNQRSLNESIKLIEYCLKKYGSEK